MNQGRAGVSREALGCREQSRVSFCGCRQRPSLANRSCVAREGSVVGEPAVHAHRRRSIKPVEEGQLLQVIGVTVLHRYRSYIGSGERITNLVVILATSHLPDVPPGGG